MSIQGKKEWKLGANGSQTVNNGWHDGNGTVSQSIPVDTGEWGPTPTTTNQQLCWQGWYYSKNRWCWGNGNLTSGNIRSGVSIFGVWGNYQGSVTWLIKDGVVNSSVETWIVWAERPNDDSNSYGKTKYAASALPSTTINGVKWIQLTHHDSRWETEYYTVFANIMGTKLPYTGSTYKDFAFSGTFGGDFWISDWWYNVDYYAMIGSSRNQFVMGDVSPRENSRHNAGGFSISNGGAASRGTWDGIVISGGFSVVIEISSTDYLWARNLWVNSVK